MRKYDDTIMTMDDSREVSLTFPILLFLSQFKAALASNIKPE
jgi:hypothetical protein